jgi:hypothetical protein
LPSANNHNYLTLNANYNPLVIAKYTSGDPVQVWIKQVSPGLSNDYYFKHSGNNLSEDPSNPGHLALVIKYWKNDNTVTNVVLIYFKDDGTDLTFRPIVRTTYNTNSKEKQGSSLFTDS